MWNKTAVALVAFISLAGLPLPISAGELGPGGTFTDDNNNTHEGFIEAIAAADITKGCNAEGTMYCPGTDVTRSQMASFLARALNLAAVTSDYFVDDNGNPHEANINSVAEAGIALGIGNKRFDPSGTVTRAQMASFLARALELPASSNNVFEDDEGNSHEANINSVADAEITLGCDGTGVNYCPLASVRRDQMASFLGRGLGLEEIDVPSGWPTDGTPLTDAEAIALFSLYFEPDDVDTALYVAQCESNLDPTAVNPSGLHGGLFQHAISAWDSRAELAGWAGASIFDPEANTAVSAWLVEVGGWSHWSCWNG